jgi:hypothetical protein
MGITIPFGGKEWTFSRLSFFKDLGELTRLARSDAYNSWREARKNDPPEEDGGRNRLMELSTILFSRMGQGVLDLMAFPAVRYKMIEMSLRKKHPDVTSETIDAFFDNEQLAQDLIDLVVRMSFGTPDKREEGKQSGENPPGPSTDSTSESVLPSVG